MAPTGQLFPRKRTVGTIWKIGRELRKTSARLRGAQSSRFRYGADNVRKLVVYISGGIDHEAINAPGQSRSEDYRRNASMSAIDIVSSPLSEADHRAQLCRAVIASTVGTTIEWYDFFLYGQVTGLVFGKLFFPRSDPLVGVLQAFAIYAVGFVARPLRAAVFGHYGDRIGRKAALITTLLVTGLATFAVGFVPTYEQVGIFGAVILTIIRFIQGLGLGGEWGGSVLLSMEWARSNAHRGFIASWPQFGAPAGFFLANL